MACDIAVREDIVIQCGSFNTGRAYFFTYEYTSSFDDATASWNWHPPLRPAKSTRKIVLKKCSQAAGRVAHNIPLGIIPATIIRIFSISLNSSVLGRFIIWIWIFGRIVLWWCTPHQIFVRYLWNFLRIYSWFSLWFGRLRVFDFALFLFITFTTAATTAVIASRTTQNRHVSLYQHHTHWAHEAYPDFFFCFFFFFFLFSLSSSCDESALESAELLCFDFFLRFTFFTTNWKIHVKCGSRI